MEAMGSVLGGKHSLSKTLFIVDLKEMLINKNNLKALLGSIN